MNRKFLLYVATVAVSLVSTFAMAGEDAPTRDQVIGKFFAARADGTLLRTDYDIENAVLKAGPGVSRAQMVADAAAASASRKALKGSDANRTYNPFGTDIQRVSTLARAEAKADVLQAAAEGTLRRTDHDDAASVARAGKARQAGDRLAQRARAGASGG